jgi:hypothetical protein
MMSKRIACLAAALLLALPALAAAETWSNVSLVDQSCATKAKVAENPDGHTRDCALQCSKNGYGVFTADGKYLKFDAAGSEKALAALRASSQKDHLRVTVTGTVEGDTITVATLELAQPAG